GDPQLALAAAEQAATLAPGELLPLVQQALLQELWMKDPAAADAAWTRVLALSKSSSDLSSMLERMRARVRLERHRRTLDAPAPPAGARRTSSRRSVSGDGADRARSAAALRAVPPTS